VETTRWYIEDELNVVAMHQLVMVVVSLHETQQTLVLH